MDSHDILSLLEEFRQAADTTDSFDVYPIGKDSWEGPPAGVAPLAFYPGPLSEGSKVGYWDVCPELVATTLDAFCSSDKVEYLCCLGDWMMSSSRTIAEGNTPDAAVMYFLHRFPTEAVMIGAVAQAHNMSTIAWLYGKELP